MLVAFMPKYVEIVLNVVVAVGFEKIALVCDDVIEKKN